MSRNGHRFTDLTPTSRRREEADCSTCRNRSEATCVHKSCRNPVWQSIPELNLCRECALRIQAKVNAYLTPMWAFVDWEPTPEQRAAQPQTQQPGTIYYLKIGDQIKVGYASDLASRMKAYPPNTVLLATHPGTKANETTLHRLFVEYRVAGREWYRPDPKLLDHIEQVRQTHGEPRNLFERRKRSASRARPAPTGRPFQVEPGTYSPGYRVPLGYEDSGMQAS